MIAGTYGYRGWSGACYVYKKQDTGEFSFLQQLRPSDPHSVGYFGLNIAIWEKTIVVGAPYNRPFGQRNAGTVYVFEEQDNGLFAQTARIVPSDSQENGRFGYAVHIHKQTIVVGARSTDTLLANAGGKIYIYRRSSAGSWGLSQEILGATPGIHFGDEVRIVEDVLLIGSPRAYDGQGTAFVYEHDGTEFRFVQELNVSPPDGVHINGQEHFGEGIAISEDAKRLLVGGENMNSEGGWGTGAAQLYERAEAGWILRQNLGPDRSGSIRYAQRLAIRGNVIVITAWTSGEAAPRAGSAYVYVRCDDGTYRYQDLIYDPLGQEGDSFGKMIDLSDDVMVIGANKDADAGLDAGAVHIYNLLGLISNVLPSASPEPTSTPTETPTPAPTPAQTPTPTPEVLIDELSLISSPDLYTIGEDKTLRLEFSTSQPGRVIRVSVNAVGYGLLSTQRYLIAESQRGVLTFTLSIPADVPVRTRLRIRIGMWTAENPGWMNTIIPQIRYAAVAEPDTITDIDFLAFSFVPQTVAIGEAALVTVRYNSLEDGRLVQLLARNASGQLYVENISVSVGEGELKISLQLPSTLTTGDIVRLRIAMLPSSASWRNRIIGPFLSSTTVAN